MKKEKDYFIDKDGLKCDPKEVKPEYKDIINAAEREAEENLSKIGLKPGRLGYCHALWPEMQRILWEKYKIKWKTPAERNPWVKFD